MRSWPSAVRWPNAWDAADRSSVATHGKSRLSIAALISTTGTPHNLLIAASAMAAIPTIVFFLIFQRNIMAGLTAGGIRG